MKPPNNDYEGSVPITQRSQGPSLAVLPDCIFREVLAWAGKGEFLFIGTINRRFYKVYKKLTGNTRTSYASAFSSIPRSKMTLQQSDRLKFSACGTAARWGYLEVLKWARANGCPWGSSTCTYAARGGNLDVLKWARANGCDWDGWTCAYAAEGGYLDVLRWARANGCPWNERTCSYAAEGGHLDILKWARENGCDWNYELCLAWAHPLHRPEMEKWMETQREARSTTRL